ncbi:hypothetical protein [Janthinobacterium tructae]|uniref:Uncharacterized protein n=1 Tax=Janthinobacterium tructae TaxID=2590869 RepID=A0A4Y6RKN6_9BURK|nr:hypothetical protein [Janthinobacterium tructae]QDG73499.1 hypothetical protein FJQ89_26045 [Janthinobacterium tructae]
MKAERTLPAVAALFEDADYNEFCRLRDFRKIGAEVPQYTEAEAFALATSKSKACNPAITKAASNE